MTESRTSCSAEDVVRMCRIVAFNLRTKPNGDSWEYTDDLIYITFHADITEVLIRKPGRYSRAWVRVFERRPKLDGSPTTLVYRPGLWTEYLRRLHEDANAIESVRLAEDPFSPVDDASIFGEAANGE